MSTLRRILGRLALACVLCQACGIALPAALLWPAPESSACTCATGNHAMCPMHHQSRTRCAVRAAADDGIAVLGPLALLGLLAPRPGPIVPPAATAVTAPLAMSGIPDRPTRPDPPPPRA